MVFSIAFLRFLSGSLRLGIVHSSSFTFSREISDESKVKRKDTYACFLDVHTKTTSIKLLRNYRPAYSYIQYIAVQKYDLGSLR